MELPDRDLMTGRLNFQSAIERSYLKALANFQYHQRPLGPISAFEFLSLNSKILIHWEVKNIQKIKYSRQCRNISWLSFSHFLTKWLNPSVELEGYGRKARLRKDQKIRVGDTNRDCCVLVELAEITGALQHVRAPSSDIRARLVHLQATFRSLLRRGVIPANGIHAVSWPTRQKDAGSMLGVGHRRRGFNLSIGCILETRVTPAFSDWWGGLIFARNHDVTRG